MDYKEGFETMDEMREFLKKYTNNDSTKPYTDKWERLKEEIKEKIKEAEGHIDYNGYIDVIVCVLKDVLNCMEQIEKE